MRTFRTVALFALVASSTVVAQINLGDLVNAVIIPGSTALIDLGVLAGILSPADVTTLRPGGGERDTDSHPSFAQCAANSVVGLQASAIVGSLLRVCLCVEVIGVSTLVSLRG